MSATCPEPIISIGIEMKEMSRRQAADLVVRSAAGLMLVRNTVSAEGSNLGLLQRAIPSSAEKLPVIGLGSWQVFDVGPDQSQRQPLDEVLTRFTGLGGRVVDSSPMYGRAEQVIGDIAAKLQLRDSLFLATKVWTTGKNEGVASMERSLARLQTKRLDLMQVHNLVDAQTHLATLRSWKEQGRVRYIGITHYTSSSYPEVVKLLRTEKVDFLQINYSLGEREAEKEIFPLAQDRGIAVIANRPFGGGDLFSQVRQKPLPDWAAEFDCNSWAQFLLKWIVAHPAVTCVIPATANVRHLEDNMRAGLGRMPEAKQRQRMIDTIAQL